MSEEGATRKWEIYNIFTLTLDWVALDHLAFNFYLCFVWLATLLPFDFLFFFAHRGLVTKMLVVDQAWVCRKYYRLSTCFFEKFILHTSICHEMIFLVFDGELVLVLHSTILCTSNPVLFPETHANMLFDILLIIVAMLKALRANMSMFFQLMAEGSWSSWNSCECINSNCPCKRAAKWGPTSSHEYWFAI